jgi:hypothetical protein
LAVRVDAPGAIYKYIFPQWYNINAKRKDRTLFHIFGVKGEALKG